MSTDGGPRAPRRFQTPSHLDAPDKFQLGWLTFTPRQAGVMALGGSCVYLAWKGLAFLHPYHLDALRIGVGLVLLAVFLVLATFKLERRYLEHWFLLWLEYRLSPRAYVWRRLPSLEERSPEKAEPPQEKGASSMEEEQP